MKETKQVIANGTPKPDAGTQMITAEGLEKEVDYKNGTTRIRTYLPVGIGFTEEDFTGTAIAANATAAKTELYYLKDNLGSPEVIVDAARKELQRMSYDAWGRKRNNDGSTGGFASVNQATTFGNNEDHRGYTDQEQLDELTLVHLNGRVYDPLSSRFVSPDPTIPDPYDLQSLNRASYVRNSPMDKTDPTRFADCDEEHTCPAATYGFRCMRREPKDRGYSREFEEYRVSPFGSP